MESLTLVPTMGALHPGHLALIEEGGGKADRVAATIFVNPLQFGANEDLDRYPRQEEKDAAMLAEAGCDLLWLPAAADMYPPGFATAVSVKGLSDRWEGRGGRATSTGSRPSSPSCFAPAVRPDIALFGEKDLQQLAVIRRMAQDLQLGVEVLGVRTVRDLDGLALSSCNAYLSADERRRAVELPARLKRGCWSRSCREPGCLRRWKNPRNA